MELNHSERIELAKWVIQIGHYASTAPIIKAADTIIAEALGARLADTAWHAMDEAAEVLQWQPTHAQVTAARRLLFGDPEPASDHWDDLTRKALIEAHYAK